MASWASRPELGQRGRPWLQTAEALPTGAWESLHASGELWECSPFLWLGICPIGEDESSVPGSRLHEAIETIAALHLGLFRKLTCFLGAIGLMESHCITFPM